MTDFNLSNHIRDLYANGVKSASNYKEKLQSCVTQVQSTAQQEIQQRLFQFRMNKCYFDFKHGKDSEFEFHNKTVKIITNDTDVPFVLVIPNDLDSANKQKLAMTTNNCETLHDRKLWSSGLEAAHALTSAINDKGPVIVPILPSNGNDGDDDDLKNGVEHIEGRPYYQQLARECVTNGNQTDIDVCNCITKAKQILSDKPYNLKCDDKIFLQGYSSSGGFAQRFCLLHPDLIDRASIGGASDSIPVIDDDINYPAGTGDIDKITGKDFDIESYKKINFDYYVGDHEYNLDGAVRIYVDSDGKKQKCSMYDCYTGFDRSCPTEIANAMKAKYQKDGDSWDRIKAIEANMIENGIVNFQHNILKNMTHNTYAVHCFIESDAEKYKDIRGAGESGEVDKQVKNSYDKCLADMNERERYEKIQNDAKELDEMLDDNVQEEQQYCEIGDM